MQLCYLSEDWNAPARRDGWRVRWRCGRTRLEGVGWERQGRKFSASHVQSAIIIQKKFAPSGIPLTWGFLGNSDWGIKGTSFYARKAWSKVGCWSRMVMLRSLARWRNWPTIWPSAASWIGGTLIWDLRKVRRVERGLMHVSWGALLGYERYGCEAQQKVHHAKVENLLTPPCHFYQACLIWRTSWRKQSIYRVGLFTIAITPLGSWFLNVRFLHPSLPLPICKHIKHWR